PAAGAARAHPPPGRRAGPRPHGPPHPRGDRRHLRRWAGGPRHHGRGARRVGRHPRGDLRALPDAAGPGDAHAARPGHHGAGPAAPGPAHPRRRRPPREPDVIGLWLLTTLACGGAELPTTTITLDGT